MEQNTTDALNAAAGRQLAAKDIDGITARVDDAIHDLEAEDPTAWRELPIEERIARAGELAQTRYKMALIAGQRREVERMAAHPDIARAPITSSAVLNGYVPAGVSS